MENSTTSSSSQSKLSVVVWEFVSLTKPRVNLLIMFTAIVGMLLAQGRELHYELILLASLGIGFAASAAAIGVAAFKIPSAIASAIIVL